MKAQHVIQMWNMSWHDASVFDNLSEAAAKSELEYRIKLTPSVGWRLIIRSFSISETVISSKKGYELI